MKGVLASPSFRKSKPPEAEQQPRNTGCMPGIFFFFHRNHHSHRKRLSAASGKEERRVAPPEPAKASASPAQKPPEKKVALKRAGSPDLSRGSRGELSEPRSPTIPAAIRLCAPAPASADPLPETPRRSPALVARLMGLEEFPAGTPESATDKRRKLLSALEKCDEDLKALRDIIEALRVSEVGTPGGERREEAAGLKGEEDEEQPSPVSVLEAASASPPAKREKRKTRGGFSLEARIERVPWKMCGRNATAGGGRKGRRSSSSSRAMAASVEEVWKEGVLGQRWERGRVAVALEGGILGDLVQEIIGEMDKCSDSCRRRLRF